MSRTPSPLDGSTQLRVRRGRVESVDLYEIKDTELDALEKGTPAELQLNFSLVLLSIAFAAITTLFTATFANAVIQTVYIVISSVCTLGGIYLLIAWFRTRGSVKKLCKQIRERIPPDVVAPPPEDALDSGPVVDDPDAAPPPRG